MRHTIAHLDKKSFFNEKALKNESWCKDDLYYKKIESFLLKYNGFSYTMKGGEIK